MQHKIKFLKKTVYTNFSHFFCICSYSITNDRYLNISILVQKGDLLLKHQGVDNIILISIDTELFCKRACFRAWNGFRIGFELSLGSAVKHQESIYNAPENLLHLKCVHHIGEQFHFQEEF